MIYFWFFLTKTSLSQKYQRRVTLFSIHKKILVPIFIFSNILFAFAADDEIKADNIDSKQEIIAEDLQNNTVINKNIDGYFSFLENWINCNISVVIRNVDSSVIGKLQEIYKDGILVETAFNSTIFIPKDSIAYIKISKTNRK